MLQTLGGADVASGVVKSLYDGMRHSLVIWVMDNMYLNMLGRALKFARNIVLCLNKLQDEPILVIANPLSLQFAI